MKMMKPLTAMLILNVAACVVAKKRLTDSEEKSSSPLEIHSTTAKTGLIELHRTAETAASSSSVTQNDSKWDKCYKTLTKDGKEMIKQSASTCKTADEEITAVLSEFEKDFETLKADMDKRKDAVKNLADVMAQAVKDLQGATGKSVAERLKLFSDKFLKDEKLTAAITAAFDGVPQTEREADLTLKEIQKFLETYMGKNGYTLHMVKAYDTACGSTSSAATIHLPAVALTVVGLLCASNI